MKRTLTTLLLIGATMLGAAAQSQDEDAILEALKKGNSVTPPPTEQELYGDDEEEVDAEENNLLVADSVAVAEGGRAVADSVVMRPTTLPNDSLPLAMDSVLCAWAEKHAFMAREMVIGEPPVIDSVDVAVGDIPDSVYVNRLMAIGSAIPLSYNNVVRQYIISYTTRNKKVISNALGSFSAI